MPEEPLGPPDIDSALAGVEGALEGLDPEVAEEVRNHLNAIRELVSSGGTGSALPPEAQAQAPSLDAPPSDSAMAPSEGV